MARARKTEAIEEKVEAFDSLDIGDSGERVEQWQIALLAQGGQCVSVTGSYDACTRADTSRLQSAHEIEPTGVVDKQTWELLL